MLISEFTKTKWNSRTKKYYEEKGYLFTKIGEEFEIKISDLKRYSKEFISVECDYNEDGCEKVISKMYGDYIDSHIVINTDCCNNENCKQKKYQDSMNIKYGVDNYFSLSPFIGNKNYEFKDTNITCLNCGKVSHRNEQEILNYKRHFCNNDCKNEYFRKNSELDDEYKIRNSIEYKQWRNLVISRDHKTCQCCGKHNNLHVHHIESFNNNEELRLDVDNGITLCEDCHSSTKYGSFHNIYGTKSFSKENLYEYIKLSKNGKYDELKKLNSKYTIPIVKECSRCKRLMPNTLEFFCKDKYNRDELACACKDCRRPNGNKKLTDEILNEGLKSVGY